MDFKYFLVVLLFSVKTISGTTTSTISTTSIPPTSPSPITESTTTEASTLEPKTTPVPDTTTNSPSTTTSAPSTTTSAPSTTTSAPSTTTSAPSTTSAPPAPLPEPTMGSWILNNTEENITCAIIHLALRIAVPYKVGTNESQVALFNLPNNARLDGKCDSTTIEHNSTDIKLMWSNDSNYLDVSFLRDDVKKSFNITQLTLVLNTSGSAFTNSTVNNKLTFVSNGSGLFAVDNVPVGSSYKCSRKVNVNVTDVNNTESDDALLTFSKVQIQVFMNSTSDVGFGSALECPGLDASDIVPIAVGCALAGLVIGVLIAYLVGRRRSHARGYLSM